MTKKDEIFTKLEVDIETGLSVEREMTVEEIAEIQEMRLQTINDQNEKEAKAAARASALAKLAELGLTAEEIAAL